MENEEDERLKQLIRDLKIKKGSRKAKEETLSLKAACIEISNNNHTNWKRRRLDQERNRAKYESLGDKVLEKGKRLSKGREKNRKLPQSLKSHGKIQTKGRDKDRINQKTLNW